MGAGPPLTLAETTEILRLAREGLGRNEIMRRVHRSSYSVTKICNDAGITFDRSATKAAVAARTIDLKARRLEIQIELLAAAKEDLARRKQPYEVHAFVGGPAGAEFMKATLDLPPAGEARSFMQAATYAIKAQLDIESRDSDNGVGSVTNMLRGLGEALGLTTHGG